MFWYRAVRLAGVDIQMSGRAQMVASIGKHRSSHIPDDEIELFLKDGGHRRNEVVHGKWLSEAHAIRYAAYAFVCTLPVSNFFLEGKDEQLWSDVLSDLRRCWSAASVLDD